MSLHFEHKTIKTFLLSEFDRRKSRNTSYSLRAFARDIAISPSRLSEIFSGTHGLSEKTADTIAAKLKLNTLEKKFWRDLVLSQASRNKRVKSLAQERLQDIRKTESLLQLKEDQFKTIADWYHGAILELTQVKGFKPDVAWIGEKLGISKIQATEAIARLQKLSLLEIKNGDWKVKPEAYSAFSKTPSVAIRKFHRQILNNGIESLLNDKMEDRELRSMILAIPKNRFPEFRQEIKNFMLKFWEKLEADEKTELYSLSIQLCPVRNRIRGKEDIK